MKLYYIKNSNRTFTGNGTVNVPKDVIANIATIYGGNIFSDDILVFTGKTITEDGRTCRDYSEVMKAIASEAEDEEIYPVFECYNWTPDFDYNDPGTYYNAMDNYNTSKEDYEEARAWATTAEFIPKGKVKNTNWNEAEKFASLYIDYENVTVHTHMAGEKGLTNVTETIRALADKGSADLEFDDISVVKLWNLVAKGTTGSVRDAYFDFDIPSLILNMDVAKCPYCGQYYMPHLEKYMLAKPWEEGEVIRTPYDNNVLAKCPECHHELTRKDIDNGQKYVRQLQEYELKKKEIEQTVQEDIKDGMTVKRGQCKVQVNVKPKLEMKDIKDEDEIPEASPCVYVDPTTITPQEKYVYKPCTFKPTPKKAWKVPKLTGSLFIDWNPGVVKRVDIISASDLIAEVKKTFEEADKRIAEARKNTRRKQNKVEVIPPLRRDFI